ncbi:hypothetical protein THAOC_34743 [Thalassiosira oceanica]|uniref:B30.2/SPRY domain-containing protein n=1 Tax=Thalassiosira oceanica TaxID=159749 RepID=K0R210_THAOC|nr:hypothetical protein THAOC_34743 [Thalassiosira oceanica]|eukprot:EJK46583.1 hypothetical protein THAOC_34743 [Thalassiosira oceanica]
MLLRGSRSSAWKRRAPDDGVAARASVTSQRPDGFGSRLGMSRATDGSTLVLACSLTYIGPLTHPRRAGPCSERGQLHELIDAPMGPDTGEGGGFLPKGHRGVHTASGVGRESNGLEFEIARSSTPHGRCVGKRPASAAFRRRRRPQAVSEAPEPSQCITGTSRSPPSAPTGTLEPNGKSQGKPRDGTTQSPPCLPAGGLLGFQMTDEQSNKRLKTTLGGAGRGNMNDTGNDALESEIGALKSEVARLRQQLQRQNALLRPLLLSQRLRPLRLQENHEALSVTVSTLTTVNLSDIDTSLVTQVASFVGTSREMLNLALACKSFGWRQTGSEMDWSLAEEVARQAVRSGLNYINGVRIALPRYVRGTRTWLSILHEFEHPLKFNTLLGRHIEHSGGDRTSVRSPTERGHYGAALASGFVMMSGIHYAEFQIRGCPHIGIVRPMPNSLILRMLARRENFDFFESELYDDFWAARTDKWGGGTVHACEYHCEEGDLSWTDWDDGGEDWADWEGMENCGLGDTVGMLLDLDMGILTVYKNNRRLGVMKDGLSGSYCCNDPLEAAQPWVAAEDVIWPHRPHQRPSPAADTMVVGFRLKSPIFSNFELAANSVPGPRNDLASRMIHCQD